MQAVQIMIRRKTSHPPIQTHTDGTNCIAADNKLSNSSYSNKQEEQQAMQIPIRRRTSHPLIQINTDRTNLIQMQPPGHCKTHINKTRKTASSVDPDLVASK